MRRLAWRVRRGRVSRLGALTDDGHRQAIADAIGDQGANLRLIGAGQAERQAARQSCQDQLPFDHRELVADALVRAQPKGQIGIAVNLANILRREALGQERLRLLKIARIALQRS